VRTRVDADRLRAFMRALARAAKVPTQIYLVGGATAVAEGWRDSTIDVDLAVDAGADAILRAIPSIKEALDINVELVSPADFIPVRPGWQERSPFVAQEGHVTFRHFDLYAQALAKIERGHETDRRDVTALLARGLIERHGLLQYFTAIEPELYRFPAIDPASFRRAVEATTATDDRGEPTAP
jgi:non-ribosomal peptide synthetase component F